VRSIRRALLGPTQPLPASRPRLSAAVQAPVLTFRADGTSLRGTARACGIALSPMQAILAERAAQVPRQPARQGQLDCPGAGAAGMSVTAPLSRAVRQQTFRLARARFGVRTLCAPCCAPPSLQALEKPKLTVLPRFSVAVTRLPLTFMRRGRLGQRRQRVARLCPSPPRIQMIGAICLSVMACPDACPPDDSDRTRMFQAVRHGRFPPYASRARFGVRPTAHPLFGELGYRRCTPVSVARRRGASASFVPARFIIVRTVDARAE
jgi:hypothetical protein